MTRLFAFICITLFAGLSLQSCKKCTTCSYSYKETTESESMCGNTEEVASFKDTWYNYEEYYGVEVTCVDDE